jgi:hypothetical protein
VVRIWFDGPVETMFLTLRVENERLSEGRELLLPREVTDLTS